MSGYPPLLTGVQIGELASKAGEVAHIWQLRATLRIGHNWAVTQGEFMGDVLWSGAVAFAGLLAVPTITCAIECFAGSLPNRRRPTVPEQKTRSPVAILVPAHNEERGIARTIGSIRAQMIGDDRVLVVADNCTDDTALVARQAGAEVIERASLDQRGKGYALDFGLKHLALSPRAVVVFIDADCTLLTNCLNELVWAAAASARPVQACNLMVAPAGRPGRLGIAEFAFRVKNLVRPRGLARLGLPCLLTGTGMAIPWPLIEKAQFATGHLAEDMRLGLDLAAAGHAPLYCEAAGVRSAFPETQSGAASQRNRWESGHLAIIAACAPSLFSRRVFTNPASLALTLDAIVPPLVLLCALHIFAMALGLAAGAFGGGWSALGFATASAAFFISGIIAAWFAHGRHVLLPADLLTMPGYVLSKLLAYPKAIFGNRQKTWVRSDRNSN